MTRAVYIRELSDEERRRGQLERITGLLHELEEDMSADAFLSGSTPIEGEGRA